MMRIFTNDNYSTDELSLIKKEHRKAYLELFKSTLFVQILFPVFLSFVFYSLISNVLLFGWLFAISLVTLLRCLLTFYWYKIDFCHKKNNIFEIFSLLLSLLAGCLWGITVVIMDFNHPMAGKDLYFTGTIQDLREAEKAEIEHGHVHGPGGHQH